MNIKDPCISQKLFEKVSAQFMEEHSDVTEIHTNNRLLMADDIGSFDGMQSSLEQEVRVLEKKSKENSRLSKYSRRELRTSLK
jgi:hypothetical protein